MCAPWQQRGGSSGSQLVVMLWAPCCTGDYTVKFLVDGQWRLAPHWPTRDDAAGTTNNVLQIE